MNTLSQLPSTSSSPRASLLSTLAPLVASALFATGCAAEGANAGITAPATEGAAEATSAEQVASTSSAVTPWCTGPKVFALNHISLPGRSEHRLVFAPDGKTAWYSFASDVYPFETLVESRLVGGTWSAAITLPFSGVDDDTDAFLAPDGRSFYFSSDRPIHPGEPVRDEWDMWTVERTATGWGTPRHLGPEVNTPGYNELYPSMTRDGTLYFASDRPGGVGGWDLYRASKTRAGFAASENLGPEVNSTYWEYNPWISPDGIFLVYASLNRPEGHGLGDLYGSVRIGPRFLPSRNLGPEINTAADEYGPTLSHDFRRVYFTRQTYSPGDTSDVYVADTTCFLAH